ncbi:MAG: DNA gyrase inhibitor YacG [Cellvibrionales bacterium]|nr:DNA gyrase inhibitor YacG [Cellvibrionales bacterium]
MSEQQGKPSKIIWQTCPNCQTKIQYRKDNPFRPFCSERCKNSDFLGWTEEKHRIEDKLPFSELDADFDEHH